MAEKEDKWARLNMHKPYAKKVRIYAQEHNMKYFKVIEDALDLYFKQQQQQQEDD